MTGSALEAGLPQDRLAAVASPARSAFRRLLRGCSDPVPVHSHSWGHAEADAVWEAIQNDRALPAGYSHLTQHRQYMSLAVPTPASE